MLIYIYKVVNKINNKIYIGITKNFNKRKTKHIQSAKYEPIYIFSQALIKYGFENFTWEIICVAFDAETANKLEIEFIKQYNSCYLNGGHGYNGTFGGSGTLGLTLSNERRKHLSEIQSGEKAYNYNKKFSIETKNKMSLSAAGKNNAFYGKTHTEQTKVILSNRFSGENKPMYGKTHTEKAVKKILDKVQKHKVILINNITKEEIIFISISELSRYLNCSRSIIRKHIKNKNIKRLEEYTITSA